MALEKLKDIGLSDGEIRVYEALLDLGEATKTNLAKSSGVSPSNIYDITNRLIKKGIVSKVEKNGIAHFSPANPKHIIDFIKEKEKEINTQKEVVENLLPGLLLRFNNTNEKVNVEVFNSWNGLKTVFEDLIEECVKDDENFVFGASRGNEQTERKADNFFPLYSRLRAEKGIKTQIIFNEALRNNKRLSYISKSKKYEKKFLVQTTPAEIMLYKDKACIIILTNEPLVIRITSSDVFKSFKQQFDVLWKIAKK
ncbi:hypothetical protein KA107_02555 [Candidatus Pacearchaeota archaeon]|nr:hypothetical protein [Candidatus Pacearchaeota archaeon]